MSNIETTNASKVEFRSKFVKAVSPELLPKFEEITNSFIEESPASAIKFLWKLTYAPEETIESIGFTSLPFSLSGEDDEKPYLSAGTITLFRNELRYQFTIRHNDFLKIPSMSEDCKKIYNRLEGIANSIVAYVLYDHCFSLVYFGREEATRCLHLLKSEYSNYIHGGIRLLRFNAEQANYLKSFLKEILDLLETLQNEYSKKYLAPEELPSFDSGNPSITNKLDFEAHQPLDIGITEKSAPSEEQLGVHDKYQPTSTPITEKAVPSEEQLKIHDKYQSTGTPITEKAVPSEEQLGIQDIIDNFEPINNFMQSIEQILSLGLDPKSLLSNKEGITLILKGISALH